MDILSSRINTDNNDFNQNPPPPPYTSVIYKLNGNEAHGIFPPAYSDVDTQSITYINNYPGPPLTDGQVQGTSELPTNHHETRISEKIRTYVLIDAIVTILIGTSIVGIEIGIIASDSIIYYYYGFWGGAILISMGIGNMLLCRRRHHVDCGKFFRSFFWQMILIGIVFGVGIAIVLTDRCNDNGTETSGLNATCRKSHEILDGFLLGLFALAFLLSIINTTAFRFLKDNRR